VANNKNNNSDGLEQPADDVLNKKTDNNSAQHNKKL